MKTIKDFEESRSNIAELSNMINASVKELTNNIYSTLNQLTFSSRVLVDIENYINKFVGNVGGLTNRVGIALTQPNIDTRIELNRELAFNTEFNKTITGLESFAKVVMEAISEKLASTSITPEQTFTIKEIYTEYCTRKRFVNTWTTSTRDLNNFSRDYNDLFSMTNILNEESMTSSQVYLLGVYNKYKDYYLDMDNVFLQVPPRNITIISTDVVDSLRKIINYKFESRIFVEYIETLHSIKDETKSLLERLVGYMDDLVTDNIDYEPGFKDNSQHSQVFYEAIKLLTELMNHIDLNYPTDTASLANITSNGDFQSITNAIINLLTKEVSNMFKLLDSANRDYKEVASLESIRGIAKTFDPNVAFNIIYRFDTQLRMYLDGSSRVRMIDLIRPFVIDDESQNVRNSIEDLAKGDSFVSKLVMGGMATEPLYDILNYFRVLLFNYTFDVGLVIDILSTFKIHGINKVRDDIQIVLDDIFEVTIANTDYHSVDRGRIVETITAAYPVIGTLDYYSIEAIINKIKDIDEDSVETWADLRTLMTDDSTKRVLDVIIYNVTSILLYNKLDLGEVLTQLSRKVNIKTNFYKLIFGMAIDIIIDRIETEYDGEEIPIDLAPYYDSVKYRFEFNDDLAHIKKLINANQLVNGKDVLFTSEKILNFTDNDSIWLPEERNKVRELFSIYKEV